MTTVNEKGKVGFGINDCPIAIYKAFKEPCKERCNDVHWIRLKELLDTEKAYELLAMALQQNQTAIEYEGFEEPQQDEEVKEIKTYIGGKEIENGN